VVGPRVLHALDVRRGRAGPGLVLGRLAWATLDVRRGRRPAAWRASAWRSASAAVAIRVRAARLEDADGVAALLGDLGYASTSAQAADRLAALDADPQSLLLVAEVDGEVAGFASLHVQPLIESDEPGCVFTALVVGERLRRHGVGRLLADAIESEARARGGRRIVLNSNERRADAHAFYEALGYEHTGRRYAKKL
jgi:GNAT superfamily N-acetyltransferase